MSTTYDQRRARRLPERVVIDGRLVHPRANHGVGNAYTNFGCRCEPCTSAWRASVRKRRMSRRAARVPDVDGFLVTAAPVRHGLYSTRTNWGCQCRPCLDAAAAYARAGYARKYGEVVSPQN